MSFARSLAAILSFAAIHCGSGASSDAPAPEQDVAENKPAAGDDEAGAPPAPVACGDPSIASAIGKCLDAGGAPDDCLAKSAPSRDACDADGDGLHDALEDAS